MSCNYADGLSPYEYKGVLGLPEKFDSKEEVERKVSQLADWMNDAKHVVVHTGAGISTSAGIPDFRGPNGVWTLENLGMKPDINISFDDAVPTYTHLALAKLAAIGKIHYIVSQNIDGLHLRSGLPRSFLSELHGNMFVDECDKCERQYVRNNATKSVGQKRQGLSCPLASSSSKRPCRGHLCDTILDWEAHLPEKDLQMAEYHSRVADLNIALGTTLQIVPSGNLPTYSKKNGGRFVICNLQPTKHDKKADLIINYYVDDVMKVLMTKLGLNPDAYNPKKDPTKKDFSQCTPMEWTISARQVKLMLNVYESFRKKQAEKRKVSNKQGSCDKTKVKGESEDLVEEEPDLKVPKTELTEIKEEKTEISEVKDVKTELIEVKDEETEGQCNGQDVKTEGRSDLSSDLPSS